MAITLFLGKFDHVIDSKGRLAVPARFRDGLQGNSVITRGAERCLVIYPESTWSTLRASISNLPISDPNARMFRRFMFSDAAPLDLDGQGRVMVPAPLRSYAQIDRSVVVVGMDATIEIWSDTAWSQIEADLDRHADAITDRLSSVI